MANASTETTSRPRSQPLSAAFTSLSGFIGAGIVSFGAGALVGVGTAYRIAREPDAPSYFGFSLAIVFLLVGCLFLFVQTRVLDWRHAAGVYEANSHQRKTAPRPILVVSRELRREAGLYLLLIGGAFVLRIPELFRSLNTAETQLLVFARSGPGYALTHQVGYENQLLSSVLLSLCLDSWRASNWLSDWYGVSPLWLLRLPSFLLGVATVPLLYGVGRRIFTRPVGLVAAILFAVSPTAITLSTLALGYAAVIFFAILQSYLFFRALRKPDAGLWVAWLISVTLGTMAHLSFLGVVVADGLFMVGYAVWARWGLLHRERGRTLLEQAFLMIFLWACWGGIVYSGIGVETLLEVAKFWQFLPSVSVMKIVEAITVLSGGVLPGFWGVAYGILAGGLSACGLWHLYRERSGSAAYLPLLGGVGGVAFCLQKPESFALPFALLGLPVVPILMACGVHQLSLWVDSQQPPRRWARLTIVGVLVAGLAVLCLMASRSEMRAIWSGKRQENLPLLAKGKSRVSERRDRTHGAGRTDQ